MLLYWMESFVIGVFNIFKIQKAQGTGRVNPGGQPVANVPDTQLVPFFMLHYGLFMFVHFVFVLVMFLVRDRVYS